MWGDNWGTMIWGGISSVPSLGPSGMIGLIGALLATAWLAQRLRRSALATTIMLLATIAIPLAAVAATSLPNLFTNGTVADADEVNENFNTIAGDFSRYHLTVNGSSAGTSVPVPMAVITQLCEDDDGCEIRLFSQDRNSPGDFPFATGPYLFHSAANARWSVTVGTTLIVQATDGDGTLAHVAQTGTDCFFTDAEYTSFTSSDLVAGFNLLMWNGGVYANRMCHLTITD